MPSTNRAKGVPLNFLFTPTFPTGTAVSVNGIKGGKLNRGISQKMESADGDLTATTRFNDQIQPSLSIDTINGNATFGIDPAALGTITYDIADARNGLTTGGGGYGVTITNAFIDSEEIDWKYRDFATHPVGFGCISSDGTTSPVTITPK